MVSATRRTAVGWLRHSFLPPSETFLYTSLRALSAYDVRVFALRRRSEAKFPYDGVTTLERLPWGRIESFLYRTTRWSPRLRDWARGVRLLHAHMGWTGVHALPTARRLGLPFITSFYGQDATLRVSRKRYDPDYWYYWLGVGRLFREGDRVLVLSEHMRRTLAAQGCPEEKLRVVRLGVDVDRFAVTRDPRPGPCTVLMVGREVEKKGFDDGLRACARARAGGADLRVVLHGNHGALEGSLRALADQLGLAVSWPAPARPVAEVMARADVLLVPSRTARSGDQEGTPTVICEGSAAGLAVVATRHAGIPEQVEDGVTGWLAAERDIDGLAAHLARLAADPALRVEQGRAGREKMRREYSLEALRRSLEAVYDELS